MLNEPVRGVLADPSFYSLSGLEQLRSYLQGRMPATPHARLLGYRLTQVSSGMVVFTQPISPWFDVYDGFVDLTHTAEVSIFGAALTTSPPGTIVRTVNLSIRYLRPCTVDNESVIARGRILHVGTSVTTAETLIEDALGRAVAHATGSVVLEVIDPKPPPFVQGAEHVEEPVYATPDPPARPLPVAATFQPPASPFSQFLDADVVDVSPGRSTATMRTTEWFCNAYREVTPGIIGALGSVVSTGVGRQLLTDEKDRIVTINFTYSFLAPVYPDGRNIEAAATLRGRRDDTIVFDVQIADADGSVVLVGQATCLLRENVARPGQRPTERVLTTVLFTDLARSTEQTARLGDERWRALLDEHRALVRRALGVHKGREVKTMGDGFLATFDSPTRAVRCARDIRDGVRALGLEIRAGVHTGECDVAGSDIGGMAVNVASRVESAAGTGEVLVSATVRDLIAGSDIALTERPPTDLKGLDGKWTLYAVG